MKKKMSSNRSSCAGGSDSVFQRIKRQRRRATLEFRIMENFKNFLMLKTGKLQNFIRNELNSITSKSYVLRLLEQIDNTLKYRQQIDNNFNFNNSKKNLYPKKFYLHLGFHIYSSVLHNILYWFEWNGDTRVYLMDIIYIIMSMKNIFLFIHLFYIQLHLSCIYAHLKIFSISTKMVREHFRTIYISYFNDDTNQIRHYHQVEFEEKENFWYQNLRLLSKNGKLKSSAYLIDMAVIFITLTKRNYLLLQLIN